MRPNDRQRSRGGGGHGHHKQHQTQDPNRPPNRSQMFDSSGPDVRVRGNAYQVFDRYQAMAREAASSGDRIIAEACWQYADHYFRMIQTMGGFAQRNNQDWGDGREEGQQINPQQGQRGRQAYQGTQPTNANGHAPGERLSDQDHNAAEPGLDGVTFLQKGRGEPGGHDPEAEEPAIPELTPVVGRRS
jgi:hypothetical protein